VFRRWYPRKSTWVTPNKKPDQPFSRESGSKKAHPTALATFVTRLQAGSNRRGAMIL
jgi:hypothetical protein